VFHRASCAQWAFVPTLLVALPACHAAAPHLHDLTQFTLVLPARLGHCLPTTYIHALDPTAAPQACVAAAWLPFADYLLAFRVFPVVRSRSDFDCRFHVATFAVRLPFTIRVAVCALIARLPRSGFTATFAAATLQHYPTAAACAYLAHLQHLPLLFWCPRALPTFPTAYTITFRFGFLRFWIRLRCARGKFCSSSSVLLLHTRSPAASCPHRYLVLPTHSFYTLQSHCSLCFFSSGLVHWRIRTHTTCTCPPDYA